MDIASFKTLCSYNFADFEKTTLEYYIHEGDKILANMIEIDPMVIEIMDKLNFELAKRG